MWSHTIFATALLAGVALEAPARAAEASALEAALDLDAAPGAGVEIGRGPRLRLRLRNPTRAPIAVDGLGRDGWAPTAASSIVVTFPGGSRRVFTGPPAGRPPATAAPAEPVPPVPPGGELSLGVWPLSCAPIDEPGTYSISLTLVDSRGASLRTNFVDFQVVAPTPTGALAVSLGAPALTLARGQAGARFAVDLRNAGAAPLAVILPQDGSADLMLEPGYWLDIRDAAGRRARQAERFCGNTWAVYDETSVIRLAPATSTTTAVAIHGLEPGRYTARLHYIVTSRPSKRAAGDADDDRPNRHLEGTPPLPPHHALIFVGWARSEPVAFEVAGSDR